MLQSHQIKWKCLGHPSSRIQFFSMRPRPMFWCALFAIFFHFHCHMRAFCFRFCHFEHIWGRKNVSRDCMRNASISTVFECWKPFAWCAHNGCTNRFHFICHCLLGWLIMLRVPLLQKKLRASLDVCRCFILHIYATEDFCHFSLTNGFARHIASPAAKRQNNGIHIVHLLLSGWRSFCSRDQRKTQQKRMFTQPQTNASSYRLYSCIVRLLATMLTTNEYKKARVRTTKAGNAQLSIFPHLPRSMSGFRSQLPGEATERSLGWLPTATESISLTQPKKTAKFAYCLARSAALADTLNANVRALWINTHTHTAHDMHKVYKCGN